MGKGWQAALALCWLGACGGGEPGGFEDVVAAEELAAEQLCRRADACYPQDSDVLCEVPGDPPIYAFRAPFTASMLRCLRGVYNRHWAAFNAESQCVTALFQRVSTCIADCPPDANSCALHYDDYRQCVERLPQAYLDARDRCEGG